jgi:hypothetical protein
MPQPLLANRSDAPAPSAGAARVREGSAADVYAARGETLRREAVRLARLEWILGNARLVVFLAGAALVYFVRAHDIAPAWLVLPAVVFLLLLAKHERVNAARARAARAVDFYQRGLARLDGRWQGQGEPGTRFLEADHPYAADLDLFGRASLFELLCQARTRDGEKTLADWLRCPAAPGEIEARHAALRDLRPRLDLREDLDVLGSNFRRVVDPEGLAAWGAAAPVLDSHMARTSAALLVGLTLATVASWTVWDGSTTALLACLLLEMLFAVCYRSRVERVVHGVDRKAGDLALFGALLARLEREEFTAPRLRQLRAALDSEGAPPSVRIARLGRLAERAAWMHNQIFAPLGALLLWTTRHAFALEAWRLASGPAIGRWLAAVGELEALLALAAYSYENPADPLAEVVPDDPTFDGEALGHPLIPDSRCIRNDVCLGHGIDVFVVSGSNMSGKSTLLRTVGINAVLALAGGPVRARRLRISPLMVGATLRIQDSLEAGRSRFYAEITRVRQLVQIADSGVPPLLFLLDEILHGTNSHDRRLGAEAVVRTLVERGAIGLITTHDLALTHIADRLASRGANVHFEDHLENGVITFDYRMRPGIVRKSNALALMRAVGLPVPPDAGEDRAEPGATGTAGGPGQPG